jgi:hypothetical protein
MSFSAIFILLASLISYVVAEVELSHPHIEHEFQVQHEDYLKKEAVRARGPPLVVTEVESTVYNSADIPLQRRLDQMDSIQDSISYDPGLTLFIEPGSGKCCSRYYISSPCLDSHMNISHFYSLTDGRISYLLLL